MENSSKEVSSKLGAYLKEKRERLGLKQGDIAKKSSISVSMLSQIERGVTSPSIDTLSRICDTLGLSLSHLFATIDERNGVKVYKNGEHSFQRVNGVTLVDLFNNMDNKTLSLQRIDLDVGSSIKFEKSTDINEGDIIGYVQTGGAEITIGDEVYEVQSGDVIRFSTNLPFTILNKVGPSFTVTRKFRSLWVSVPGNKRECKFNVKE